MNVLSQAGIFKCKPTVWEVREFDSGSVAVSFKFIVLAELNLAGETAEWESWATFDEHEVYGDWFVVKKDGTINTNAVEQLAKSLGWDGDLATVTGRPPDRIVQVTVKPDVYKGETRYKGSWMNPENHTGGSSGAADSEAVKGLSARFGALLRAAAASVAPVAAAPAPTPAKAPPKGPKGPKAPEGEKPHRPNAADNDPCLCKACIPFVLLLTASLGAMLA